MSLKFGTPTKCNRDGALCGKCNKPIAQGDIICIAFPGRRPHCTNCVAEITSTPQAAEKPKTNDSIVKVLQEQKELLQGVIDRLDAFEARLNKKDLFGGVK